MKKFNTLSAVALSLSMAAGAAAGSAYISVEPRLPEPRIEHKIHPDVLKILPPHIQQIMAIAGVHAEVSRLGGDTYMQVVMPPLFHRGGPLQQEFRFSKVNSDEEMLERYARAIDSVLGISMTGFYGYKLSTHDMQFNLTFKNYHTLKEEDTPETRSAYFAEKFSQCMLGTETNPLICSYFELLDGRIR